MTTVEPDAQGADPVPVPVAAGSFAIYDDGRGGFVLVTQTEQQGIHRSHISARMVKMAAAISGGRDGLMAKLKGGKDGK